MSYRLEISKGGLQLLSYGANHPFAQVFSLRLPHDAVTKITREMILDTIEENQANMEYCVTKMERLEKILAGLTDFDARFECVREMGDLEDQIADCQKVHTMLGMLLDIVEEPCEEAIVEGGFF